VRLRSTAGSSRGAWRDDGLPWWGKPTETPAVFALERSAKDLVHESCTADTRDHEDHTFCGARRAPRARARALHARVAPAGTEPPATEPRAYRACAP